jgi:hypothetical protein
VEQLFRTLLSPVVMVWRRLVTYRWRRMPRPPRIGIVYTQGPQVLRLLLVGGGIAAGYGTLLHELALAGEIGRRITALTGRGTAVEVVTGPDVELADGAALLAEAHLARFDAIIACFGLTESATLIPEREWRHELDAFLDAIRRTAAPDLQVFVTAIPLVNGIPEVWGRLGRRRAGALNAQSLVVCERRAGVTFVFVDPLPPAPRPMRRDSYVAWADRLAPQILDTLARPAAPWPPRSRDVVDETARQAALDRLRIVEEVGEATLDRIIATARDLFGVSGAALNVIDHDRQWVMAALGVDVVDSPRDQSICDHTIREPELHVVPDVRLDERFRGMPWADGADAMRFYAGYPIETPDGQRIGALCIVDPTPRPFTEGDGALLRDLALTAQSLIWQRATVGERGDPPS